MNLVVSHVQIAAVATQKNTTCSFESRGQVFKRNPKTAFKKPLQPPKIKSNWRFKCKKSNQRENNRFSKTQPTPHNPFWTRQKTHFAPPSAFNRKNTAPT
jgi:hypothetical protein